MAKRSMPPRNKDGTFRKRKKASPRKSSSSKQRRRNPGALASSPAPAARKRAPARRAPNPKIRFNVDTIIDGATDAVQTLIGKAGVRLASGYLPMLPKVGAAGLAAEAAVALAIGLLADQLLGRQWKGASRMILAGALAAPLETAIVAANVPFLSDALSPGTTMALGRYANGYGAYAMSAYPQLTPQPDPVAHGTQYVGYDDTMHAIC